jgi:hypothetical protein
MPDGDVCFVLGDGSTVVHRPIPVSRDKIALGAMLSAEPPPSSTPQATSAPSVSA